jgi:hypothetical protein
MHEFYACHGYSKALGFGVFNTAYESYLAYGVSGRCGISKVSTSVSLVAFSYGVRRKRIPVRNNRNISKSYCNIRKTTKRKLGT